MELKFLSVSLEKHQVMLPCQGSCTVEAGMDGRTCPSNHVDPRRSCGHTKCFSQSQVASARSRSLALASRSVSRMRMRADFLCPELTTASVLVMVDDPLPAVLPYHLPPFTARLLFQRLDGEIQIQDVLQCDKHEHIVEMAEP